MTDTASLSTGLDPLRAAGSLIRLVRLLDQRIDACGRDDGLRLAELGVLAEISRGTELPSAVARAARLDPARVTRIVERLVGLGLVTRGSSTRDRRHLPLAVTPRGQERVELARADIRETMAALLDGLTAKERAALALAVEGVQRVLAEGPR